MYANLVKKNNTGTTRLNWQDTYCAGTTL